MSSDSASQGSVQDGTWDWEVGLGMPGVQEGSTEGERAGVVRRVRGYVCAAGTQALSRDILSSERVCVCVCVSVSVCTRA